MKAVLRLVPSRPASAMPDILSDFNNRRALIHNVSAREAQHRLAGLLTWMLDQPEIRSIIDDLDALDVESLLGLEDERSPTASNPEEVGAVGIYFMRRCKEGAEPWRLAMEHGVSYVGTGATIDDHTSDLLDRYIDPTLDYIENKLPAEEPADLSDLMQRQASSFPLEITDSLMRFLQDYPEIERNAFMMMQFGETRLHSEIVSAIRDTLARYGINALKADDKEYHDDLFPNVQTYLHGCGFGVAVFERLEQEDFNPNVSLEVGYMRALRKPVCLLKDKTMPTLHTDLVGKLYRAFDPQDPGGTIPAALDGWLRDKDIVTV